MIDKDVVVLQNCLQLLEVVSASYIETCLTSHDGNQVIDIEVEEVTGMQEEEDPLSVTFPVIKPEHGVSCTSVFTLLGTFHN
jgi:hypothetical protein